MSGECGIFCGIQGFIFCVRWSSVVLSVCHGGWVEGSESKEERSCRHLAPSPLFTGVEGYYAPHFPHQTPPLSSVVSAQGLTGTRSPLQSWTRY